MPLLNLLYFLLVASGVLANQKELTAPRNKNEEEIYKVLMYPHTPMGYNQFKGTITPFVQQAIEAAQSFNPDNPESFKQSACMLIFGPPLGGKALIGHLLATALNATFFELFADMFVNFSETKGRFTANYEGIRYFFKCLREYPTRVVVIVKHISQLIYPADRDDMREYRAILNTLKEEFTLCNQDPRRNAYVFVTTSDPALRAFPIYDAFNFHVFHQDFQDEKTREELFLLEAERHKIPLSRETAKKLASTTYGCTIFNIEHMASQAKKKAGSNAITEKEWFEATQGCFKPWPSDIALYGKLPQSPPWFYRAWGICSRYASHTGTFIKAIIAKVCFALAKLVYFFKR